MNKDFFQYNLAIVMGIGIGAIMCVFGQKALNAHYERTCPSKPDHVLVELNNGFVGTAKYCIERKYV